MFELGNEKSVFSHPSSSYNHPNLMIWKLLSQNSKFCFKGQSSKGLEHAVGILTSKRTSIHAYTELCTRQMPRAVLTLAQCVDNAKRCGKLSAKSFGFASFRLMTLHYNPVMILDTIRSLD